MSRADTNRFLDEYERDVDETITACHGDLRGAVRTLMLINEQVEQRLQRLSSWKDGNGPRWGSRENR